MRRTNWEKFKVDGRSKHRLYPTWTMINARCYNPNTMGYDRYGGRGIKVCDEWHNNFYAFEEWAMANGWKEGLSIDRIDNDGNYEPSNCRWTDPKTQATNRGEYTVRKEPDRDNQELRTYAKDNNVSLKEVAKVYGVSYNYFSHMIQEEFDDFTKEVLMECVDKIIRERGN